MSISGVCQVCESAEADQNCPNCGAMVCDDHYDRELRVCVQCASAARQAGGDTSKIDQSDVMR
ncbi:hypothetical protein [Haloprofundus salilacus]|uniref:hypothetical protein n=1 Tax=Haloprofundus salilacus TaxID=2876190 RepID=UPI001CC8F4D6|nr:hypothetical protein [Haloprofundus salilacus]